MDPSSIPDIPAPLDGIEYSLARRGILSLSEASFRLLLEAVPDGLLITNMDGRIVLLNGHAEQMFGYRRDELLGESIDLLVPPALRARHAHHRAHYRLDPRRRAMGPGLNLEARRKDGSTFPVEISLSPVQADASDMVISVVRDTTGQRQAMLHLQALHGQLSEVVHQRDEQLQHVNEERDRLAAIVESSQDAIIGKTLDGIITSWNSAAEALYGYSFDQVRGHHINLISPPERHGEIDRILDRLKRGETILPYETVRMSKDGSRIDISLRISPVRDARGKLVGASAIARDITRQKRMEERLRQIQRIEAVGRLAGGVAHDFNNLMAVITSVSSILMEGPVPDELLQEQLNEIRATAQRAATLTRNLLAFSRQQTLAPQILDLNQVIRGTSSILQRLLGRDCDLRLELAAELEAIEADPSQIEQVLLNLVVNARDAMAERGSVVIQTGLTSTPPAPEARAGSHWVFLRVSDSGAGMDAGTMARIFEPFFSTKDPGKGTGLGLSTVHGIVRQSGGVVQVESHLGQGTCFSIYLPALDPDAQP